ncbi:hypothetical protein GCM10010393_58640 [Streptomyces gobitricini]|uniref:Uncharacterized protein n=1 Tax=Streptomyces gobitricini TaxID=68211 RepID=A0ABN3NAT2_9ACTN
MSSLYAPARADSPREARTGTQPTLARSALTRASTAASAAASRPVPAAAGAEGGTEGTRGLSTVRSGEGVAVRVGGALLGAVFFGAGAFVRFDGAEAGGVDGVADGLVEGAVEEGAREGADVRSALRLAAVEGRSGVALEPPCAFSSGAPPTCTRPSAPLPPMVKVSPPGSRPEVTATAPTAIAAEAPSSPVRTGTTARFFRWRPISCAFLLRRPVRTSASFGHSPERVRLISSGLYAMTCGGEVLRVQLAG